MQGPTQGWDQPPDPRESTVSMPRIDPSWLADQVGEPATPANDGLTGMELPGFGDPYARPARAAASAPSAAPEMELTSRPERAAPEGSPAAGPHVPETPPAPLEPEEPEEPEDLAEPEEPAEPDATEKPEEHAAREVAAPEQPRHPVAVSSGATVEPAGRARRRTESATPGKPLTGSITELRGRLDRLPDGHPSSPYDDAGWLRPSPTRLRQLELGLPARSLGAPTGYAERFGIDPDDDWLNDEVAGAAPASSRPQTSSPGDEPPPRTTSPQESDGDDAPGAGLRPGEPGQDAGAGAAQGLVARRAKPPSRKTEPDEPPRAATSPDEPPPSAIRRAASNGRHEPRDGDRPLRLQHPYATSAEPDQGGNGSADTDLAVTRWPAGSPAADRESGPADSHNGHRRAANRPEASPAERGSPEQDRPPRDERRGYLGPREDGVAEARPQLARENRDLVDRILAACRVAEGRNARGGYGTSGLTPALRRIAAQLPAGGLAPGSEADTLKPAGRFATRLARLIDRQPGRPPAELAATISDAIRYAFSFPAGDYTEGTLLVHRKLKAHGFDLEARRNLWDSREYKGLFTRWRDPAHGLAFEVQFHTTESWAAVKQGHDAYLRITDPATPAAERARLRARQAAASARVSAPPDCLDIADFRGGVR